MKAAYKHKTIDKGYGRIETREYQTFDIRQEYCGVTNIIPNNDRMAKEFFAAVRQHWSVEVTNHIRDVTLKKTNSEQKKRLF